MACRHDSIWLVNYPTFAKWIALINNEMKSRKALFLSIARMTWRKKGIFIAASARSLNLVFLSFRRLLYVACTRAQGLLYLSHTKVRKIGGVEKPRELSFFVASCAKLPQAGLLSGCVKDVSMAHDCFSLFSLMIYQNFPPLTETLLRNSPADQHLRNQKSQGRYLNCE